MSVLIARPRRFALYLVVLASIVILAGAFVLEYRFGMRPCHLCVIERYPYAVVIAAGLVALMTGWVRAGLIIATLALAANVGIAGYHVGVEQGWFFLPDSCVSGAGAASVEELRAQLAAARPTCDQQTAVFAGLSLAAWNGIAALLLALLAITGFLAPRGTTRRQYRRV
jgi:disulfide bond formation protein DsbB